MYVWLMVGVGVGSCQALLTRDSKGEGALCSARSCKEEENFVSKFCIEGTLLRNHVGKFLGRAHGNEESVSKYGDLENNDDANNNNNKP